MTVELGKYNCNKHHSGLKIINKICFFTRSSANREEEGKGTGFYDRTVTAKRKPSYGCKNNGLSDKGNSC
jgi:hypothetical protein